MSESNDDGGAPVVKGGMACRHMNRYILLLLSYVSECIHNE